MPVSEVHRFLHGKTPRTEPYNIWVLSGQTQDLFYYNLFHGSVDVRRTLELWALENGMALTVFMDYTGALHFNGNPDPAEAERRFNGVQPQRTMPEGVRRRQRGESTPHTAQTAGQTTNPTEAQNEQNTDRAQREAERVEQAVGGQGQGIQNAFTKVTHLLRNVELPSLVIVEDLPGFLHSLQLNAQNAPLADNLLNTLRRDWHGHISHANMLVFLTHTPQGLQYMRMEVFPDPYRKTSYIALEGPKDSEIQGALERLSLRHGFHMRGAAAIAKALVRHRNLIVALGEIKRVVNSGNQEVTLENVLHLPPLNETEITRIKQEIDVLVGLEEVKSKLKQLEKHARSRRAKLESGDSDLPEETMHMVFTGRPGTGKTMVARIVARFMHALGLLPHDQVTEVIASTLISEFTGKTMENMQEALKGALGGVFFLDEAHQFGDPQSNKAKEAIQALVPMAWNHRQEMIIILAGYENRMHEFYAMDEGLERRFPKHNRIHFPDYSPEQLWTMLQSKLHARGYTLAPDAEQRARRVLARRSRRSTFGNAGGVDNLVAEIVQCHNAGSDPTTMTLTLEDLPPLIRQDPAVYNSAMKEINALVGLGPIKQELQKIVDKSRHEMLKVEAGLGTGEISLRPGNMLFVGPPGTGKTTVGRIIADVLFGIGCIEKQSYRIVTSADLIGQHIGETAPRVRAEVEKARDGVLFVDEAYSLAQGGSGNFYGAEAIAELIAQITNPDNEGTVFVLAGYEPVMMQFLRQNDGLGRRFPNIIRFPNFAPQDCVVLAREELEREGVTWEEGVLEEVGRYAAEAIRAQAERFGNAGWVKSFIEECLSRMRSRVIGSNLPATDPNFSRVMLVDLMENPSASGGQAPSATVSETMRFLAADWRPQADAVTLRSEEPDLAALTLEQVGAHVAERAFLIAVEGPDGAGHGTGFFVTPDGVMVTSAHVVNNASSIQALCGPDHAPCGCRVIAVDLNVDLALLAVETPLPTAYLTLGDSYAIARLHELVVCGNAHVQPGEPSRVVQARVSRNNPNNPRDIETDGAIEPGFSGGPVFDQNQGAVVGVVKGGFGASATLMVRAEQVRDLLAEVGYQFV